MEQMVLYGKTYCSLNMFRGTIMPIIRNSRVLYRWLLPVVLGALVYRLLVCSIPQTRHITYSSTPDQQPVNQNTKYHRQQPPV
jgi:hypothetical protein